MNKKRIIFLIIVSILFSLIASFFLKHRPHIQIPRSQAIQWLEEQYQRSVLQKEILQNKKIITKTELDIEHIPRNAALKFWTITGLISLIGTTIMVLGLSYSKAIREKGSLAMVQISEHCHFPVLHKDISQLYTLFREIGLGQVDAESLDKAFSINQAMTDQHMKIARTFKQPNTSTPLAPEITAGRMSYPSFADLYRDQALMNGTDFLVGMTPHNQPQYRPLSSLKALAIGGRQGSGKTLTLAYFLTILARFYQAKAIMIDPHKTHRTESLSALMEPLALLNWVKIYDAIDLHVALDQIEGHFSRRMADTESTDQPILFVIDEMSGLLRNVKASPIFVRLVTFLERATQETRKTNITFIGGAHTWDARQFKNLAYIRNSFNSCLLHWMKPNEVSFFFEEKKDQKKIKQIQAPGDALIQIDFDTELEQIHVPLIQHTDIQQVALDMSPSTKLENVAPEASCEAIEGKTEWLVPKSDQVAKILQQQREDSPLGKMEWTKDFSQQTGISESMLNSILTGHRTLSPENTERCWQVLS